jgi:hypothetical protein
MIKVRVKKNLSSLLDPSNCGVTSQMVELEGRIIEVDKPSTYTYKEHEFIRTEGAGWNWDWNWLEPIDKNEAYFLQWKIGQ